MTTKTATPKTVKCEQCPARYPKNDRGQTSKLCPKCREARDQPKGKPAEPELTEVVRKDLDRARSLYQSKLELTLVIARCVEPNTGNSATEPAEKSEGKISAKRFARECGNITDVTVARYVRTWDHMAERAIVPSRDKLVPGEDVELPTFEIWQKNYREANPPKEKTEPATVTPVASGQQSRTYFEGLRTAAQNIPGDRGEKIRAMIAELDTLWAEDDPAFKPEMRESAA